MRDLVPEDNFLSQNDGPVTLKIQVPDEPDRTEFDFKGQVLNITLHVRDQVSLLKDKIQEKLNLPKNKQKLNAWDLPFLKDNSTLAFYNLKAGTTLWLGVKERGGRK